MMCVSSHRKKKEEVKENSFPVPYLYKLRGSKKGRRMGQRTSNT